MTRAPIKTLALGSDLYDIYAETYPDILGFLDVERAPETWYWLILNLDAGVRGSWDVIDWVLDQPDCPNAVATIFLLGQRLGLLISGKAEPVETHPWRLRREQRALERVLAREAAGGYPETTLSDTKTLEIAEGRLRMIKTCQFHVDLAQKEGRRLRYPPPMRTLSATPTGPQPESGYLIDANGLGRWRDT